MNDDLLNFIRQHPYMSIFILFILVMLFYYRYYVLIYWRIFFKYFVEVFVEEKDMRGSKEKQELEKQELEKELNELEQEIEQLIKVEEDINLNQEKQNKIVFRFSFFNAYSKILELIKKKFKNFKTKIRLWTFYLIKYLIKVLKKLNSKK